MRLTTALALAPDKRARAAEAVIRALGLNIACRRTVSEYDKNEENGLRNNWVKVKQLGRDGIKKEDQELYIQFFLSI